MYILNNKGFRLLDFRLRHNCKSPYNILTFCNEVEQNANDGDSVATCEIPARMSKTGNPVVIRLDITECFDYKECDGE